VGGEGAKEETVTPPETCPFQSTAERNRKKDKRTPKNRKDSPYVAKQRRHITGGVLSQWLSLGVPRRTRGRDNPSK